MDKNCLEIRYQDVILRFKEGEKKEALKRLKNLIAKDRQFFLHALIDPDLSPFVDEIHPVLSDIHNKAKSEAHETLNSAKNEYKKSKVLLPPNYPNGTFLDS